MKSNRIQWMALVLFALGCANGWATLTVTATRAVTGSGSYPANGGTIDVSVTFTATTDGVGKDELLSLNLSETLPTGWTFAEIVGVPGQLLSGGWTHGDFVWLTTPRYPEDFPATLVYRVSVPAGGSGDQTISGVGTYNAYTNDQTPLTVADTTVPLGYVITANVGVGGTMNPSGQVGVIAGHDQIFQFTAEPGFSVQAVLVDGNDQGSTLSYTFANVIADHELEVVFQAGGATIQASDAVYCDRVQITWRITPGAAAYKIYRDNALLTTEGIPYGFYDDMTAEPGEHSYQVTSIGSAGNESALSPPDTGSINTSPLAPANVSATDGKFADHVTVTWDPADRALEYRVYRSNSPLDTVNAVPIGDWIAATTFDDMTALAPSIVAAAGCNPGVTTFFYGYYFVRARNACNNEGGPFSMPDEGYVEQTGGKRFLVEKSAAAKTAGDGALIVQPDSVLSIPLSDTSGIDRSSVWGRIKMDAFDDAAVHWWDTDGAGERAGRVVYIPNGEWPVGAHITMTVGAVSKSGVLLGPVTQEFIVEPAAPPAEAGIATRSLWGDLFLWVLTIATLVVSSLRAARKDTAAVKRATLSIVIAVLGGLSLLGCTPKIPSGEWKGVLPDGVIVNFITDNNTVPWFRAGAIRVVASPAAKVTGASSFSIGQASNSTSLHGEGWVQGAFNGNNATGTAGFVCGACADAGCAKYEIPWDAALVTAKDAPAEAGPAKAAVAPGANASASAEALPVDLVPAPSGRLEAATGDRPAPASGAEFFYFTLDAPSAVQLLLTSYDPGEGLELRIQLINESGETVAAPSGNLVSGYPLEPGLYFLRIEVAAPPLGDNASYKLQVLTSPK